MTIYVSSRRNPCVWLVYTSQQQFYLRQLLLRKNNKRMKKLVDGFLQDGASVGIQSLHTSIVKNSAKSQGIDLRLLL